jgi:hypothetical protein
MEIDAVHVRQNLSPWFTGIAVVLLAACLMIGIMSATVETKNSPQWPDIRSPKMSRLAPDLTPL